MIGRGERRPFATRRGFLAAAAGVGGAVLAGPPSVLYAEDGPSLPSVEPFFGAHQAGIVTPVQRHAYFAAFDLTTDNRADVASYSYDEGANMTAERWPPWKQGMEFDAGLLFVCFQRDPRKGFIPIFEKMSRFDMMNQFVTNTGGGLFACPAGIARGDWIGRALFET
jgi:deferrochelatase/peroxidase EfeB